MRGAVDAAVRDAVGGAVRGAVGTAVGTAVDAAVGTAVDGAVRDAVRTAVDGAVGGAVRGAVGTAVRGAVDAAVRAAVGAAVDGAVGTAVDAAVRGAVRTAVDGAVCDAVGGAVRAAVFGAVGTAVFGAVGTAVDGAVDAAVRDAVGAARRAAVGDDSNVLTKGALDAIRRGWSNRFGGRWWAGGWWYGFAWPSYFRDVVGLEFESPEVWERHEAHKNMSSAGWVWLHKDFAMVCELPTMIAREEPRGTAVRRLHCTDGPAITWADGTCLYFIRGARIDDADFIKNNALLTVERVQAERNVEVRRIMIDLYGAARYLREANAQLRHEDETGRLWALPQRGDVDIVMIEVVNSTPEPIDYTPAEGESGEWRQKRWFKHYWLRVPPTTKSAREGVAWTFGMAAEEYAPSVES